MQGMRVRELRTFYHACGRSESWSLLPCRSPPGIALISTYINWLAKHDIPEPPCTPHAEPISPCIPLCAMIKRMAHRFRKHVAHLAAWALARSTAATGVGVSTATTRQAPSSYRGIMLYKPLPLPCLDYSFVSLLPQPTHKLPGLGEAGQIPTRFHGNISPTRTPTKRPPSSPSCPCH